MTVCVCACSEQCQLLDCICWKAFIGFFSVLLHQNSQSSQQDFNGGKTRHRLFTMAFRLLLTCCQGCIYEVILTSGSCEHRTKFPSGCVHCGQVSATRRPGGGCRTHLFQEPHSKSHSVSSHKTFNSCLPQAEKQSPKSTQKSIINCLTFLG